MDVKSKEKMEGKCPYSPSLMNPPQTIVALTWTEKPKMMRKSGIASAMALSHFWRKRDDSEQVAVVMVDTK